MSKRFEMGLLRRASNGVATPFIRMGFGLKGTYLLTTIGRKTGKELTHPVQLIIDGDRRWLVAPYGVVAWVHNARAAGEVRLRSGSDDHRYRIREVTPEEAGPVLKRYVKIAPIVLGYFEAKRGSPVEDFVAEAHLHPVFELEPFA